MKVQETSMTRSFVPLIISIVVISLILVISFMFNIHHYPFWIKEDGIIESLSVLGYVAAALYMIMKGKWEYIKKYSPYHNLKEGIEYPEVFFSTSTRDDRVHPGHARKMAAKMNDMGYKTYYYENTEGGHAGSSTNEQRAKLIAMRYSFLLMKLNL